MTEYLDILMILGLCGGLLLGYPVAFTLIGLSIFFAFFGWWTGHFDLSLMGALGQRLFGTLTNSVLIAIPMFVFMGIVLQKSQIAEDLLSEMGRLFGRVRGGLGVSVIIVGALLAASTGIVGATVVAMGLIALPAMLRNGYNPKFTCGLICTAGTLGQIIPPSTLLIILSDVMSNAFQQAQFTAGKFSVETISVGQTFAAALIPGLVMVSLYIIFTLGWAWLRPSDAPPVEADLGGRPGWRKLLRTLGIPLVLIIAVLGSILGGVATPTEAASVGAVGALFMAAFRVGTTRWQRNLLYFGLIAIALLAIQATMAPVRLQRSDLSTVQVALGIGGGILAVIALSAVAVTVWRAWRSNIMRPVVTDTMSITAMIFTTIIAASVFALVFRGLGGDERVHGILEVLPGGPHQSLMFVMVLIFLLGFFLDFVEISIIVLPLVVPQLILMGHDPIWLSVLIAINLQTSFLTPPFGFSLFYLRGVAPKDRISTGQIYAGVMPFIAIQAVAITVIWLLPSLATWLPALLF